MSTERDNVIPSFAGRARWASRLARTTAAVVLAAAVIGTAVAPSGATSGAHFTSLERWLVDADDDGGEPGDEDGFGDDLQVTFSEVGIGTGAEIEVSRVREITARCVSAAGEFDVYNYGTSGVIGISGRGLFDYAQDDDDASLEMSFDENGRLTGAAQFLTDVVDVCPPYHPDYEATAAGLVYAIHDYRVAYSDVTVTDHSNGDVSASIGEPITYTTDCVRLYGYGSVEDGWVQIKAGACNQLTGV